MFFDLVLVLCSAGGSTQPCPRYLYLSRSAVVPWSSCSENIMKAKDPTFHEGQARPEPHTPLDPGPGHRTPGLAPSFKL